MIAKSETPTDRRPARATRQVLTIAAVAATAGLVLHAATAAARLVGVTAQGDAVLIESTEPAAYSVSRPDPMTLVVDMRNVDVADARNDVGRQGAIAGVRLEQTTAADGKAVARVHVALQRPSEYAVRSSRNTIRVELTPKAAASAPAPTPAAAKASTPPLAPPPPPTPAPAAASTPPVVHARTTSPAAVPPPVIVVEKGRVTATLLERLRTSKTATETTVTLLGNGPLIPVNVVESKDRPRRLVLDFPNVTSKMPTQTAIDSALVSRVRVGVNSQSPLVTRVVMQIADGALYRVERSGDEGRDLAVVFQQGKGSAPPAAAPVAAAAPAPSEAEPLLTLQQAMANVAAITAEQPRAPAQQQAPPPQAPPTPPAPTLQPLQAPAPPTSQTPATQTTAPAPSPGGQQRRVYTGHAISLDFEGVDLRAVLRTFADVSGLNMVIDPDVQGTVDIKLTDVPWDQALDVILQGNQLDYSVDGTIVRISKIKTLEDENKARQAAAVAASERAAQAGGLVFETFPLSYAKAADLAPLLKGSLRLSKYGQVQTDTRTNTLIIADLPDSFPAIRQLLSSLDRAEPQVEVEARIVQTTRDFARAIGVQWGLNGRVMPDIGNTTGLAFPNRGTLGGRLGDTQGSNDPRSTDLEQTSSAVRLGVPDATSAIGLALGAVNGAFNLDVALSALERSGKGRVLSTPRLTTQNNIEAEVAQGIQIPIQVVSNNTVTVTFKDATLSLRVTPQITASNTVIMRIVIENASADFSRQVNGIPPVNTQRANTQVQIDDGSTTVIGGIFVSTETSSVGQTPLLHRIPLLGWLFKNERLEDESRELLIFITPRILKG